jgi:hypothetical protein
MRTRAGVVWVALSLSVLTAHAAAPLFPRPLHIVRMIEDPIAQSSVTIDEYCAGNRIVTVSGARVVITDFDAKQLTEIDHAKATWSVTRFDDIAAARRSVSRAAKTAPAWTATPLGLRGALDRFEFVDSSTGSKRRVDVGIDRRVTLSRDAVEALIGASYPNPHNDENDAILRSAEQSGVYGLPSDTAITVTSGDLTLTLHSVIVRTGDETVPPDALVIAPGTTRVDSKLVRASRELQALDHPAATH